MARSCSAASAGANTTCAAADCAYACPLSVTSTATRIGASQPPGSADHGKVQRTSDAFTKTAGTTRSARRHASVGAGWKCAPRTVSVMLPTASTLNGAAGSASATASVVHSGTKAGTTASSASGASY